MLKTFDTPGPVALEVSLPAGEVRLATHDAPQTVVELEPLRDNDASREAVENARVEMRERPDGGHDVIVQVRDRSRGLFSRGAEVLTRVACPHGTAVDLETASADVEGRGRFGAVEVSVASGDVSFETIEGDAKVETASGDVEIEHVGGDARVNAASGDVEIRAVAGSCEVNSASGDVALGDVGGDFAANTASGDVTVRGDVGSSVRVATASGDQQISRVSRGSVELSSASGDVHVGIAAGARLWVDVRSRSGDVRSDLPVGEEPPAEGEPTLEVRANTISGDIRLVRAGA